MHQAHAASRSWAHTEAVSGVAAQDTQGYHEDEHEVLEASRGAARKIAEVSQTGQGAAFAREEERDQEEDNSEISQSYFSRSNSSS
jgi:hypothetical protein